MQQKDINNSELQDFVSFNNLSNSNSNIQFIGLVSISTELNTIDKRQMEIIITFEGYNNYGTISLLDSGLDPFLFPTVYDAKWQEMKYVNNMYLNITDTHTKNPNIGKYDVKIIPIRKIRD